MIETRQNYASKSAPQYPDLPHVIGNDLIFIEAPTSDDVLSKYFAVTLTGLIITGDPPQAAFDLQLANLHTDLDRVRWALGDLCVAYSLKFGGNVYAKAAAMCGFWRSMATIEKWASIARQVPLEVRVPAEVDGQPTGMSIYWHAHVTGLPTVTQRELLQNCLASNLTEAQFEQLCQNWRNSHNVKPALRGYKPTFTSLTDVNFQLTTELGLAESRLEAAAVEASELAVTVTATDARLRALAWDVVKLLAGGEAD